MEPLQRPIGWWVKELDRRIDASFAHVVREAGLDRRQWQVLETLSRAPATTDEVATALEPFWEVGAPAAADVLAALQGRGLVAPGGDGCWRPTDEGRACHAAAGREVAAVRQRLADGIAPDDYERTVATLARMTANLS
jgi:DNA-binding MarR family transcriptional regulator